MRTPRAHATPPRRAHTPHAPSPCRCGEWEVEQLSEITGDPSTRGTQVKCRLSVPTCKAAFMDSQRIEQLGVGQATANSDQTVLSFDEFSECVARCALAKYHPVKQLDNGARIIAFVKNLVGEASEEACMIEATRIKAVRTRRLALECLPSPPSIHAVAPRSTPTAQLPS